MYANKRNDEIKKNTLQCFQIFIPSSFKEATIMLMIEEEHFPAIKFIQSNTYVRK